MFVLLGYVTLFQYCIIKMLVFHSETFALVIVHRDLLPTTV